MFVIWELFDDVCYCQATLWLLITCIARCQQFFFLSASLFDDVFTFWHKPSSSSSSLLWFFFLLYRWSTSRVSYFMLGNIVCTHLPQIKIRRLRYRRCWILFGFFLAFIDALLRKMMFSNDAARLVLMLSQRNFAPKRFEQIDINMRYLMNS